MTWQFIQKLTNYVSWTYSILSFRSEMRGKAGQSLPPHLPLMGPRIYLISTDKRPPPRSKYHTSPAPLSYKRPLPIPYTLLNIRDTKKTCFYCNFIYNFLNFNYNFIPIQLFPE